MKALIFDLDGTLIDSVYPHTLAWQQAFSEFGIEAAAYAIHRRIGMSGELLVKAVAREHDRRVRTGDIQKLEQRHAALMRKLAPVSPPLPGAKELVGHLKRMGVAHGIATSGKRSGIAKSLHALGLAKSAVVVDGEMVKQVKPEPDIFVLCQERLQVEAADCLIVGDAIWDVHAARRAGILSVGVLTGGTGSQELYNAGAMRVYRDAAELLKSLSELGMEEG